MHKILLNLWSLGWRICCLIMIWQLILSLAFKQGASFAESNLVSNQIRIQSLSLANNNEISLLGSSMMARITPEGIAKETHLSQISQLGLDGGRTILGLSLLEELQKKPNFLILEGNSMSYLETPNDQLLRQETNNPVFKIANYVPWVRAKNRPSALLYSKLKYWNDFRKLRPLEKESELTLPPFGIANSSSLIELSLGEQELVSEFTRKLKIIGVPLDQVLIVMLPNGDREDLAAYRIANQLSVNLGISILDLKGHAPTDAYRYTDGLHLNVGSGARVATLIGKAVNSIKK